MPKWYVWARNILKGIGVGAAAGAATGGKAGAIAGGVGGGIKSAHDMYEQQKANDKAKKARRKLREEEAKAKRMVDAMTPGVKSDEQLMQERKEQIAKEELLRQKAVGPSQIPGIPENPEARKRGEEISLLTNQQEQLQNYGALGALGSGPLANPHLTTPLVPAGGYTEGMQPSNIPTYADNIPGMQEALVRQQGQQDALQQAGQIQGVSPQQAGQQQPYDIFLQDYANKQRDYFGQYTTPMLTARARKEGLGRGGMLENLIAKYANENERDITSQQYQEAWRILEHRNKLKNEALQVKQFEPVHKEKDASTKDYLVAGALKAGEKVLDAGIDYGMKKLLGDNTNQATVG